MDVGIIGFARSGKTSLFNALTGQQAEVGGYSAPGAQPNVAVVKVPDPRIERLVELFKAPKIVHASITYIDVPGIAAGEERKAGALEDSLIKALANADALMAVIRGFAQDGRAPDIANEADAIQADLLLTDLSRVELRIEKIEKAVGKQVGDAKKRLEQELALMLKAKACLEGEKPLRGMTFDADEDRILRAFQFMTEKPLILVLNLGEDDLADAAAREDALRQRGLPPETSVIACCAKNEMEISRIEDPAERKEFLESFGIAEAAADRIIRLTYETLGLLAFFTAGPTEVHAWTIERGQTALKAAGRIHSDLERGFIRADVIATEDLLRTGSMAAAKKEGVLRTEGKTYEMKDGDVIEIKFSV